MERVFNVEGDPTSMLLELTDDGHLWLAMAHCRVLVALSSLFASEFESWINYTCIDSTNVLNLVMVIGFGSCGQGESLGRNVSPAHKHLGKVVQLEYHLCSRLNEPQRTNAEGCLNHISSR